jgi:FixJ family two-component response regulator
MTATASSYSRASPGYIAIVDDDESVRRAYARLIGTFSFCVRTYGSGSEFFDTLSTGVPSCLIVDLQMDDMTGLELLHRLANMGLRIPAIVVTARDEPGVQDHCNHWGAVAFLVKPVMGDLLLRAIEDAIRVPVCHDAQREG